MKVNPYHSVNEDTKPETSNLADYETEVCRVADFLAQFYERKARWTPTHPAYQGEIEQHLERAKQYRQNPNQVKCSRGFIDMRPDLLWHD